MVMSVGMKLSREIQNVLKSTGNNYQIWGVKKRREAIKNYFSFFLPETTAWVVVAFSDWDCRKMAG